MPDTPRMREVARSRAAEHEQLLGHFPDTRARPGLYAFPRPERWWSANRTPLAPGFVTESVDGSPVAPLMGDYPGHDVGTLRVRTLPSFWMHASADHAVITCLTPSGPERTMIRVQWLVDRDALEGRDYQLDRLLPFWRLTSEQDSELCERNHMGVRNPAFTPGPFSPTREGSVIASDDWYVARLTGPSNMTEAAFERRPTSLGTSMCDASIMSGCSG